MINAACRKKTGPRPLATALLIGLGSTLWLPGVARAADATSIVADDTARSYAIAAGPLADVVAQFAALSGVPLSFDPAPLADRRSDGLQGRYTVREGFDRLLDGSGFMLVDKGAGAYSLQPVPAGAVVLPAVKIEGAVTANPATSEGTQTYAAHAVSVFKGAQSLREIPQSVSVITRQRMEDQNLNTVAEVLLNTPGLSQAAAVEPTKFFSRGYELQTQVDGSPGLSLNFTSPYDAALYDRIEVLRGPAGLLSGSGEPGGTISLVRKRPLERFAVSGSFGAGSWDRYRGDIDVSSQLNRSGSVRGRAVIAGEDRDNFTDFDYRRTLTGYGVLEADVGDRTTLGFTAAGHEQERQGSSMGGPADRPRDSFVGADVERRSTREDYGVDVTHRLSREWTVKASLAQASHERDGRTSYLSAYNPETGSGTLVVYPLRAVYESQNLDASVNGPFRFLGRQHHLTLGYNWALGEDTTYRNTWPGYDIENILTDHEVPEDQQGVFTGEYSTTRIKQSGLFGAVRLRVLEPLTLVVGGRFSNYARDVRTAATGWTASGARARGEFSPYGGLIWDVSEPVSLYASYSDIFVPQTQKSFEGDTLDPRVGWQGEAGAKGEFLDGRLNASVAVFRLRDSNRALRDERYADTACDGGICYVAAGLAQSQGWELEINGAPFANLELSASYTRNDTKYLRDSNAANVGKPVIVSAPRHMGKLWTVYRFDAGWSLGGGVNAQSETYVGRQGGYALYSLQLGYRINPHWSATLTGNNLTDKHYYAWAEGGNSWNVWGEPRNVVVTLRGHW